MFTGQHDILPTLHQAQWETKHKTTKQYMQIKTIEDYNMMPRKTEYKSKWKSW